MRSFSLHQLRFWNRIGSWGASDFSARLQAPWRNFAPAVLLLALTIVVSAAPARLDASQSMGLQALAGKNLSWEGQYQFGYVAVGQTLTHTFTWRNPTARPWMIRFVQPSCDCVRVTAFPHTIPARGEGQVAVSITPSKDGDLEWILTVQIEGQPLPALFRLAARVFDKNAADDPSLLVNPRTLLSRTNETIAHTCPVSPKQVTALEKLDVCDNVTVGA